MSVSTDIFLNENIETISKVLGVEFHDARDPNFVRQEFEGIGFRLILLPDPDLEDDGDLPLSRFKMQIGIACDRSVDGIAVSHQVQVYLGKWIRRLLQRHGVSDCLLVEDLQRRID